MKVLICGDRKWGAWTDGSHNKINGHNPFAVNRTKLVYKAMKTLTSTDTVVEGEAAGADILARLICELRDIPVLGFPADWCDFGITCQKVHTHSGKMAGNLRNKKMIDQHPDEVWAFHDDLSLSKGTISTIRMAWKSGIPVKWFSPHFTSGVVITPSNYVQMIDNNQKRTTLDTDEIPF